MAAVTEAMLIQLRIVDYDSDYEPTRGDAGNGASTADPYAGELLLHEPVDDVHVAFRYLLL